MKILSLETSAKAVSAAVVENGIPLSSTYQCVGLTHSRTLMPMVDAMLRSSEMQLSDMDAIAVAIGPGSFTGIRIGIAAAKGLAWAKELPCVGVSTLEAMAQGVAHMDGLIVCAMDARRSQVYNALFEAKDGVLTRLCPDRPIALNELADEVKNLPGPKIIVGDGAALCYNNLSNNGISCRMAPPRLIMQHAIGVGLVAERMALSGQTVTAQDLKPVYLRLSQAERERNERIGAVQHE